MDLHNPKVERAVIEHIRFAQKVVNTALGDVPIDEPKELALAVRQQLIGFVFNYTLALDWRLKNTLMELPASDLPIGKSLEDITL